MEIAAFKDMKYWFVVQDNMEPGTFSVITTEGPEPKVVCEVTESGDSLLFDPAMDDEMMTEIHAEFDKYKTRPEYIVSTFGIGTKIASDEEPEMYDTLLIGSYLMRAYDLQKFGSDIDESLEKFSEKCVGWLHTTDFYACPASTKYHESYPGGLLHHTLEVVKHIKELLVVPSFKNVKMYSAVMCALMHDWCKIGLYEQYLRNVKDDKGKWEQVVAYKHSGNVMMPIGHGTASYFLASRFFKLSVEESLAIRWHMGAWYVCDSEMNDLQQSNEMFPLVHLLQFADQLSITNYGQTSAE